MCKHGTTIRTKVRLKTGGRPYFTDLDSCIVPIIVDLQVAGRITRQSCCCHGRWPGWVQWEDKSYSMLNDLNKRIPYQSDTGSLIRRRSEWWADYENMKKYPEYLNMKLGAMLPLVMFVRRDFSLIRRLFTK